MPELSALRAVADGELVTPDQPAYDAARRPMNQAHSGGHPRAVLRCRSVADVVAALAFARLSGDRVAVRGGGHCFAGRSSTDGILLDLSGLDGIDVADEGTATIGAGARLAQVYAGLHAHGVTLPAGCGPTVGIAGLTLGGGIGLLGRQHGVTCDHLIGARVVLSDGRVVDCDTEQHPDLFWALRGAGGGQFAVVISLRFATVEEPQAVRIEAYLPSADLERLVMAWQAWAPEAPDQVTVDLTLSCDPGSPAQATLSGLSTLTVDATRKVLNPFLSETGAAQHTTLAAAAAYHQVKASFTDPRASTAPQRLRSEFFDKPMSEATIHTLTGLLQQPAATGRRLTFTAMGGAYNRVPEGATAFAHRGQRHLLEHVGSPDDQWVDHSWKVAHAEGSGCVYPNFPDPALRDWATAYHGRNYPRLVTVKASYDPDRFFDFPQAI